MSTCTAPGSNCTITCPNGCMALCCPCRTRCSGSAPLEELPQEPFAIQISEMQAAEVARILGAHLPQHLTASLAASAKPISLTLERATLAQLVEALHKAH